MSDNSEGQEIGDPSPDKKKPLQVEVTLKYNVKPVEDLIDALHKQVNAQQKQHNTGKSIGERQVEAQEEGNIISKRNTRIAAALAFLTLAAIIFSIAGLNTATHTANIADSTAIQARRANDLTERNIRSSDSTAAANYQLAKATFDSTNLANNRRFRMDSSTSATQQNEFEIENRSFIQFDGIQYIDDKKFLPQIVITLANYGKLPARIINGKGIVTLYSTDKNRKPNLTNWMELANRWLPNSRPIAIAMPNDNLNPTDWDEIVKGLPILLYLACQIVYESPTTNKQVVYNFAVQITTGTNWKFIILKNKTKYLK